MPKNHQRYLDGLTEAETKDLAGSALEMLPDDKAIEAIKEWAAAKDARREELAAHLAEEDAASTD
jgi:hypothetical protein